MKWIPRRILVSWVTLSRCWILQTYEVLRKGIFLNEIINKEVLFLNLHQSPSLLTNPANNTEKRKLGLYTLIPLCPEVNDRMSQANCCSCSPDASRAVNSRFLSCIRCQNPLYEILKHQLETDHRVS